jgi:hypothetical protein
LPADDEGDLMKSLIGGLVPLTPPWKAAHDKAREPRP